MTGSHSEQGLSHSCDPDLAFIFLAVLAVRSLLLRSELRF
jgi:hypothetical protein